jgi:hypothetical protein
MSDLYQLAEGESRRFKVTPSKSLPGDTVTVRSSHPLSASVHMDQSPIGEGVIASGHITGGRVPESGVAIQATVLHADNSTTTSVWLMDVGGGSPPAPKPAPPKEAIRVHLTLEPSMASKAAEKKQPVPIKAEPSSAEKS